MLILFSLKTRYMLKTLILKKNYTRLYAFVLILYSIV